MLIQLTGNARGERGGRNARGERGGSEASHEPSTVSDLEIQHPDDRLTSSTGSSRHSHYRQRQNSAVVAGAGDQPCSSGLSAGSSGTQPRTQQQQRRSEETRNNPGGYMCNYNANN